MIINFKQLNSVLGFLVRVRQDNLVSFGGLIRLISTRPIFLKICGIFQMCKSFCYKDKSGTKDNFARSSVVLQYMLERPILFNFWGNL